MEVGGAWSQAELAPRESNWHGEGLQGYFLEEAA